MLAQVLNIEDSKASVGLVCSFRNIRWHISIYWQFLLIYDYLDYRNAQAQKQSTLIRCYLERIGRLPN